MATPVPSRYPYTYAADYLRGFGGFDRRGTRLSRADASQVRQAVSKALGLDDAEVAERLADYYLAHQTELTIEAGKRALQALSPR